jgi:pyruvate, water dikinase
MFVKGAKLVHNNAMTAHSTDILWFNNIVKEDTFSAGQKAVTLGQLLQAGFPIPDGFIVTSLAYFHFLHHNKLIPKINQLLTTINYEHPESVLQVASHIQKLILTTKPADTDISEITKAYNRLNGSFTNAPVMMQLSPTSITSSNLAHTFANVHGDTNLILKIKQTWASLFTPEMIMNRHVKHIDHFQEGIAIIIQKSVVAEHSGTVLTIDPVTQDKTRLIIEVIDNTTDHYVINKTISDHEVIQKNVVGEQQKISDKEIETLAALGKKLEKHLYFPQEISWALAKGTIYIIQTKPLPMHPSSENLSSIATNLPILLKGVPASLGIVTGRVKEISHIKDMEKLVHGDIIVAEDLSANHKQLLKKASGIVTDKGGRTSPIAILARELGIPAIVGTKHATANFKTGQMITLDGSAGYIYQGARTSQAALTFPRQTTTHLYTEISEFGDIEAADLDTDGLLLLPKNSLNNLTKTLSDICQNAGSHPVIYRVPDPLPQGANPLIGFRGTYRLLHNPDSFKQELHVLKDVRKKENCKNLAVLLPFVRSLHELTEIKHLMAEFGLSRTLEFNLWIEMAIPGNIVLLDEFLASGIDGIVIDIDTLSQLLLGLDKTNSEIAYGYDALDPAILMTLEKIIRTAHKHGIKTAVYGETLSHHTSMVEKFVTWGVTALAVEQNLTHQTRTHMKEVERRLVESRHSS